MKRSMSAHIYYTYYTWIKAKSIELQAWFIIIVYSELFISHCAAWTLRLFCSDKGHFICPFKSTLFFILDRVAVDPEPLRGHWIRDGVKSNSWWDTVCPLHGNLHRHCLWAIKNNQSTYWDVHGGGRKLRGNPQRIYKILHKNYKDLSTVLRCYYACYY